MSAERDREEREEREKERLVEEREEKERREKRVTKKEGGQMGKERWGRRGREEMKEKLSIHISGLSLNYPATLSGQPILESATAGLKQILPCQ